MKIGAFLIGGLVGATAAVMLSRNNRGKWMMAGLSTASESMSKMWDRKKWSTAERESHKWSAGGERQGERKWAEKAGDHDHHDSASAKAGQDNLAEVRKIVDKDPELKQHVAQILSDNEQSAKFVNH